MTSRGFTLLELTITMALLAVVAVLVFFAMASSTQAVAASDAQSRVQQAARDVVRVMRQEVEVAASDDQPANGVLGARLLEGGQAGVRFQVPTDGTGDNWSSPITYQFVTEDTNGNAILDASEDTDGDGALTRRIVRMQDLNGDGDTLDPGETTSLGAVNDIAAAQFALNNGTLTVSLTSTVAFGPRRNLMARAQTIDSIFLLN